MYVIEFGDIIDILNNKEGDRFVPTKTIIHNDAPPSPSLDSKESNYVKGGSKWDLVSLPASNTKGG
jgi:hypothetical protein